MLMRCAECGGTDWAYCADMTIPLLRRCVACGQIQEMPLDEWQVEEIVYPGRPVPVAMQ